LPREWMHAVKVGQSRAVLDGVARESSGRLVTIGLGVVEFVRCGFLV
jgi:hypothetical protein